jgi:hypothetical protein
LACLVGACSAQSAPDAAASGGPSDLDHLDAGALQAPPVSIPDIVSPARDAGGSSSFDDPTSSLDAGAQPSSDAGHIDPCDGYPPEGECVAPNSVYRCVIPTGNGTPVLSIELCGSTERCSDDGGEAHCEPVPGLCTPGDTQCLNPNTQRTCDTNGVWQSSACAAGCQASALGAACSSVATAAYSGTLWYEARGPNQALTDWSPTPEELRAGGVLIVSSRDGEVVDSTTTDDQGAFEIQIPATHEAGDELLAMLVRPAESGNGVAFAVLQPDVPDGRVSAYAAGDGAEPQHWFWSIDSSVVPSGSSLLIREEDGSGAMRVFQNLRSAYDLTEEHYGEGGKRLVVWLRMNTSWDCGACFFDLAVNAGGLVFDSQIVLPATSQDTSYWADPVTSHELGHWVMSAYGKNPGEGGPHCVGVATFPGQAWSEGWATGFSSIIRSDEKYYDKQSGSFFWLDLAERTYFGEGEPWQRADAQAGLLQLIDEFEVSAMLWDLHDNVGVSTGRLLDALASPRVTTSPFARGYTRHQWSLGNGCAQQGVVDDGSSQPMFADYLDALRCDGVSAERIDSATVPETYYPYPSSSPLCLP